MRKENETQTSKFFRAELIAIVNGELFPRMYFGDGCDKWKSPRVLLPLWQMYQEDLKIKIELPNYLKLLVT